jgi:Flp pilus assembly protein TadB
MQGRSCVERHPILASVGVPVLAALVAYWWSAAAVVVVAAAVCVCVMLHRWWRFEVAAHRQQAALLHAAEDELDAAEHELVTRGGSPRLRSSRR